MSLNQHISGQLFGYSTLPEASGPWGILLPRPGDKSERSTPDAQDVVQEVTSAHLVFDASQRVSDRGFLLTICAPAAIALSLIVPKLFELNEAPWHFVMFASVVVLTFLTGLIFTAYRCARPPPPIYISRTLRKVLAWQEKTKSWLALDYDSLVPVTFPYRMITNSGSATLYALTLHHLKPGTREVEHAIAPTPLRGTPEECRANWEFIRGYMDGKPEDLPPIRLVPSTKNPKAWMARTDRTVFGGLIDSEHRVNREHLLFGNFVVYFWGMVSYWGERADVLPCSRTSRMEVSHFVLRGLANNVADIRGLNNVAPIISRSTFEQMRKSNTPHMQSATRVTGIALGTAVPVVGWVLLGVGIAASVGAALMEPTRLEAWARQTPFGNGPDGQKFKTLEEQEKALYEALGLAVKPETREAQAA